ncbi:MAG TPA: hypothetical protein VMV83_15910 [Rectinemataceae bacterium]|nr:hypothetical protein [Rectinemataceae bacterium]
MGFGWRPYVSVAERRRKAEKEMAKLSKKGGLAKPVHIEGNAIAKSFWGKAWCKNLESYSDFENRLPRGRTYVRNGAVCHLDILPGEVRAKVSGSELYDVTIKIKRLDPTAWQAIKDRCTGEIDSILDLLGGKLAAGVMAVVTDREKGLFPKPREISLNCSCPDWADMCKHVAATLYGVGARLDENPELLFVLRGVDHQELVSAKVEEAVAAVVKGGSRRRLAEGDLSEVFGLEMEEGAQADSGAAKSQMGKAGTGGRASRAVSATDGPSAFPAELTGRQVRELRERLGLNGRDFAELLGVSGAAVSVWENAGGILKLQERSRRALEKVWDRAEKKAARSKATATHRLKVKMASSTKAKRANTALKKS